METEFKLTQSELDAIKRRSTRIDAKYILTVLNKACKAFERGSHYEIRDTRTGIYLIKLSYNKRNALAKGLLSLTFQCNGTAELCSKLARELKKYVPFEE